ncbi:MAG: mycothiol synthase [Dehalococcoidia bacterium]|nr:mycothiol synthase [Dehalococcoidia bacterium]
MHHIEIVSQLERAHLAQLPELLGAATRADDHEPIGEHKFLRLQHGRDLGVAVLAYEDNLLAGYAHTLTFGAGDDRRVSCEFVVHPDMRRRGVGRTLLSHAVRHAESQGAARIDVWAYNDGVASARIAAQFGFRPARRLYHLHRSAGPSPALAPPAGAALRAYRPGADDAAWLALNNRIFAGHPENGAWTLADLRARLAQPWFCADDFLLLDLPAASGHPETAAFCWVKVENRGDDGCVGEVYVIGVAPRHRGRGFGRFLLDHALAHIARRGARTAAVYVDATNAGALQLYDDAGFRRHHVDVCYTRDLRAAARPECDEAAA